MFYYFTYYNFYVFFTSEHWFSFLLHAVLWIRIRIGIRIGSGFNSVPGSVSGSRRANMPQELEKFINFIFEVLDVLF
jgi:hypothetical protein